MKVLISILFSLNIMSLDFLEITDPDQLEIYSLRHTESINSSVETYKSFLKHYLNLRPAFHAIDYISEHTLLTEPYLKEKFTISLPLIDEKVHQKPSDYFKKTFSLIPNKHMSKESSFYYLKKACAVIYNKNQSRNYDEANLKFLAFLENYNKIGDPWDRYLSIFPHLYRGHYIDFFNFLILQSQNVEDLNQIPFDKYNRWEVDYHPEDITQKSKEKIVSLLKNDEASFSFFNRFDYFYSKSDFEILKPYLLSLSIQEHIESYYLSNYVLAWRDPYKNGIEYKLLKKYLAFVQESGIKTTPEFYYNLKKSIKSFDVNKNSTELLLSHMKKNTPFHFKMKDLNFIKFFNLGKKHFKNEDKKKMQIISSKDTNMPQKKFIAKWQAQNIPHFWEYFENIIETDPDFNEHSFQSMLQDIIDFKEILPVNDKKAFIMYFLRNIAPISKVSLQPSDLHILISGLKLDTSRREFEKKFYEEFNAYNAFCPSKLKPDHKILKDDF